MSNTGKIEAANLRARTRARDISFSIRMPVELRKKLDARSAELGLSTAQLIKRYCKHGLEQRGETRELATSAMDNLPSEALIEMAQLLARMAKQFSPDQAERPTLQIVSAMVLEIGRARLQPLQSVTR